MLEAAKGKLTDVVVIGFEKETGEIYVGSSESDIALVNFWMDRAKQYLLNEL